MSEEIETKATLATKNWILVTVVGVLFTLVNGFLTREIATTADKIEQTNKSISDLQLTVSTQQVRYNYLEERVTKLEVSKEQAAATHANLDKRIDDVEKTMIEVNANLAGPGNHK